MGMGDVLIDQPPEFLDPMLLQRHPDLERAKAATCLKPIVVQPFARGDPARRRLEIFRVNGECVSVRRRVLDQGTARFERGV